ncbi:hypothetical protein G6F42_024007 [Rhizopus arrhizus]|nr:hypothetical protein G6F42_024007 [Rhizopus arrhizus]
MIALRVIVAEERTDTSIDAIAADLLLLAHVRQDVHTVVDIQTLTATTNIIAVTVDIDTVVMMAIEAIEVIRIMAIELYSEAAQYIDTEFYPTKVYIGDLENVDERQIESVFSRFGPLESVKLVEGKDYGFITFEKKEAALSAIQSMHGALLGARHIKVNRAKIPERNKVGFGNVPWQDEDGLMAKEASFDSYTRRRSSTMMKMGLDDSNYPPIDPAAATIPRRVLTSYDDL